MSDAAVLKIVKKYGEIKQESSRRYRVLVGKDAFSKRAQTAASLAKEIGGKVTPDGKAVIYNNITWEIKPAALQGTTSSGVSNEHNLVQAINYVILNNGKKDPITIVFKDATKKFVIKNCTGASSAGADTANRKKSDVNIQTSTGAKPISLKQDNAEYWESADTLWGAKALPFLQHLLANKKVELIPQGVNDVFASPNFAIEANPQEIVDVVFGSDILALKGAVITKTFVGDDFSWNGANKTLTINCSSVITSVGDIPDSKKVYFLIRNAAGRKSIPGYSGLRVMAAYKSRINAKVIVIPMGQRSTYK